MTNIAQRATLYLLRGYKWAISPMFPPACRYVPTCSEYAMEAVERYGVLRGGLMALLRLLRCHPLVKGGYDPVVKVLPTASDRFQPALSERSESKGLATAKHALLRLFHCHPIVNRGYNPSVKVLPTTDGQRPTTVQHRHAH